MNSHQIVDIVVLAVLLYCMVKGASRGLLSQLRVANLAGRLFVDHRLAKSREERDTNADGNNHVSVDTNEQDARNLAHQGRVQATTLSNYRDT